MANSWETLVDQVISLQEEPGFDASSPPAVQWYFSQWYSDDVVMMMGWPARGIHHHLLGVAWRQRPPCSLPNDQRKLKALCQHPAGWDEIWLEVQDAWRERAGRLWQVGLVKGYLSSMVVRRSRTASSRKRWETKAVRANGLQMHESRTPAPPTQPGNTPQTGPENTPENALKSDGNSLTSKASDANAQKSDTSSSSFPPVKETALPEAHEVVLRFKTRGAPDSWCLTVGKLEEYRESFPGLDVLAELRKARQWGLDHPDRRKTAKGMPGHLGGWLGRAANRQGGNGSGQLPLAPERSLDECAKGSEPDDGSPSPNHKRWSTHLHRYMPKEEWQPAADLAREAK